MELARWVRLRSVGWVMGTSLSILRSVLADSHDWITSCIVNVEEHAMTLLCYFHLCHKSFMMYSHPALLPVHMNPPPPGYTSICRYRQKGSNLSASYLWAGGGGGVLVLAPGRWNGSNSSSLSLYLSWAETGNARWSLIVQILKSEEIV